MPIFEGLGRALRWLREGRGKRQYQVAETAGITKPMLSAYETGRQKPSLDTLEKILEAMNADLSELHGVLDIVNGRRPAPQQRDGWRDWEPGRPSGGATGATRATRADTALAEIAQGFEGLLRLLHGAVGRLEEAAGESGGGKDGKGDGDREHGHDEAAEDPEDP